MRPDESKCICPHGIRPLGLLYGVNMGKGRVRLGTFPGCPVHDSCHGYTTDVRQKMDEEFRNHGQRAYCPIHRLKTCPAPTNG